MELHDLLLREMHSSYLEEALGLEIQAFWFE
jgi:hypothetical protein